MQKDQKVVPLVPPSPEFDSSEWHAARNKKLKDWFKGNQSAVDYFVTMSRIAEIWDDVVDGDKRIARDEANTVFADLIFGLRGSTFYHEYSQFLFPLHACFANAFLDSQELERGSRSDQMHAYTLRLLALQLVPMVALLVGGHENMRKVSLESWRFFTAHDPIEAWLKE